MTGDEEGFTLIELLVVVIIIGILASIAIPVLMNQRERAYRTAVINDLRNAATAQEVHYSDLLSYTADPAALSAAGFTMSTGVVMALSTDGSNQAYCMAGRHSNHPTEIWYRAASGVHSPSSAVCGGVPVPVFP